MSGNKYLDLIDQNPELGAANDAAEKPNKYLAVLDGDTAAVKRNAFIGVRRSPAEEAAAVEIGRKLKLPAAAVSADPERFRKQAAQLDWEEIAFKHPSVKSLIAGTDLLGRLNDDVEAVKSTSTLLQEQGFRKASEGLRKAQDAEHDRAAVEDLVRTTSLDQKQAAATLAQIKAIASAMRDKGASEQAAQEAVQRHIRRFALSEVRETPFREQFKQDNPAVSTVVSGLFNTVGRPVGGLASAVQDALSPILSPYLTDPLEARSGMTAPSRGPAELAERFGQLASAYATDIQSQDFVDAQREGRALEWLGTQFLANAPSTVVSSAGMLTGLRQAATVLGAASTGAQYSTLREQGYDPSIALSAATAYGAMEMLFERQPIDIAEKLREGFAALPAEARADLGNRLVYALSAAGAIAGTNALEEYGTQVSQNVIDIFAAGAQEALGGRTDFTDAEQTKSIFEGGINALMAGAASSAAHAPLIGGQLLMLDERAVQEIALRSIMRDAQSAATAQHNAGVIDQLAAIADKSAAVARGDTEAYGQLLQRMTGEAGVENVYVPAAELVRQAGGVEAAEQAFPALAGKVEAAATSGQRVEVPLAEFLMGSRTMPELRRAAATEIDGMTAAEAEEFFATQTEEMQRKTAEVLKRAEDAQALRAELDEVRRKVDEQLAGTRMFTRTASRFYAEERTAFYAAMAERAGLSVTEMYERYPLRLTTDDVRATPESEAYRQPDGDGGVEAADGKIRFVHWSDAKNLDTLDPEMFGAGAAGAERQRRDADPENWVNRTSVAIAGGGYVREAQLGQERYTGELDAKYLYDFAKDPLGLRQKAAEQAQAAPVGAVNALNLYERMIRDAGFQGYVVDSRMGRVAQLFNPQQVLKTAPSNYAQRLIGAPYAVDVDGQTIEFDSFEPAERAAREYMDRAGLPYNPPRVYVKVDEERAKRIADEFAKMQHDPQNPEVRAAYAQLAKEVIAQYQAMLDTGIKIEFMPEGQPDPYGNPRNMMLDVAQNNHMYVYSTRAGFGTNPDFDPVDNPLLAETEFEISGQKALVNDLFRAVHDYFGHVKDGVGFRASGEENAWRSHWSMFSPLARKAMTTETRGQNSWLNFGPHGEKNRTAKTEDTIFADQKIGLLPDWVVNEGATDHDVMNSLSYAQSTAPGFYSALLKSVDKIKAKALTPDGWKAELKGLVNKQAVKQAEIDASGIIDWLDMQNVEVDGVVQKISKEAFTKTLEMSVVEVEEVLYGGDSADADDLFNEISIGRYEIDDPDPYSIEETARDIYYDEILEELKADNEDELADGTVTEDDLEEKALEKAIEQAETAYWNDDESPQNAPADLEAGGKTFTFQIEQSYGEVRVYSYDKQDYILEGSWRTDEDDIRRAIVEYATEEVGSVGDSDVDGADGPTQYHDYSSQKGSDYRELLLTIPWRSVGEGGNYASSHWSDVDNPVAHVRFSTRPNDKGDPVLFVEEIQSDWAQQGRDRGFRKDEVDTTGWALEADETNGRISVVDATGREVFYTYGSPTMAAVYNASSDEKVRSGFAAGHIAAAVNAVRERAIPSGPFVENTDAWVTLVLKRVIRWAAENGMSEVAIIGGQESADRYSLTKRISRVRTDFDENRNDDSRLLLEAYGLNGQLVARKWFPSYDAPDVSDFIGKAMAKEIADAQGVGEWTGLQIKSGGEGMLFFYGDEDGAGIGKKPDGTSSVVAKNLTKLLKQLGGDGTKVVKLDAERGSGYFIRQRSDGTYEAQAGSEVRDGFATWDEANTWLRDESGYMYEKYLGFEINDKMRELVMNTGLPLFQTDRRGEYNPSTGVIRLTQASDLSTFLHESAHQYLDILFDAASLPTASPGLASDVKTVLDWFGVPDADTWRRMSLEQRRPHHEKWAEAYEQYLFEGKAPSAKLRDAFKAFSSWLKRIYGALRGQLNPEIRGVFDRMLASEREIEVANERAGRALFESAEEAGMTDEQWLEYKADERERVEAAVDQHQRRRLRDMKWLDNAKGRTLRKLQREAAALRKGIRTEVEKEVRQMQVYRAMDFLRDGITVDADGNNVENPHKLSIDALTEMYAGTQLGSFGGKPAKWEALGRGKKNGLLAKDGLHPDVAASLLGYPSGDALVRAMLDAEPISSVIQGKTDQRMLEEHSELASLEAIEESANEALHGEAHLRFLATEHAALAKLAGARGVMVTTAKEAAREAIGNTKLRDLRPAAFVQAERDAGRRAEKAMREGDTASAAEFKRVQLINAALVRMAYEAQAETKKRVADMRKVLASDKKLSKTRDMNLVNAARALVDAYDVGGNADDPMSYLEKVKAYEPEMYDVLSAAVAPLLRTVKMAREMTLDEFRGLSDTVAQLWHLSRRSKQIEIDGKLVDRNVAIAELRAKLEPHEKTGPRPGLDADMRETDRLRVMFESWGSSLRRVESWVSMMDGGQRGPFRTYLWNPVRYGIEAYRSDVKRYLDAYRALLKSVDLKRKAPIDAREIGYTFTQGKVSLLHALLHTGNESNKRKLLLGRGWGTLNDDGTVDSTMFDAFIERMIEEGVLTKADFDFAQGVWDLLEEMKPAAQRAHKSVYGYYFDEITANEFTNKFGTYRGGYVPAQTDSYIVADAAVNEAAESLTGEGKFMFPSTGAGFTRSRVEYNKPLALDLRLMGAHIDKVLRFSHIQPPVQDVARILRAGGMRAAMERVDVTAIPDMLLPWLQRSASQAVDAPSQGKFSKASGRFFNWARSTAGMTIMFANVVNTLQQLTGFSIAALRVGPVALSKAVMHLTFSPRETMRFIHGSSPFMVNRNATQVMDITRDIKRIIVDQNLASRGVDFVRQHAYFMQQAFQSYIDSAVWLAAYREASETADHVEASRIADAQVRETQGSFSPEDISKIETGHPFYRMFIMFAGYFNMQANVMTTEFKNTIRQSGLRHGYGRLLYAYLFGFAIPAVAAEAIVRAFAPAEDDDEEEDYVVDALDALVMPQVRTALAMVPGVGMAASTALNRFDDKWYNDRLTMSPVVSVGEKAMHGAHVVMTGELFDEDVKKGEVKDFMTLLGVISGLPPVAAAGKPVGYMIDVEQGNAEPENPVDFARGLVTGR